LWVKVTACFIRTNVPALIFTGQKERAFYKPFGILGISGGSYAAAGGSVTWRGSNGA
jgi:hypothetical protein